MSDDISKQAQAMGAVMAYVESKLAESDEKPKEFDVHIVWFAKVLQNWKALVITTLPDQMYYEVTYNGDRKEMYLDAYTKVDNIVLKDESYNVDKV